MTYLQIVTEATVDLQVSYFPGWPLMVCWSVSVEGHPLSPAISLYCFRTPFAEQERSCNTLLLGSRTTFPLSPPCSLSWHRNSKINERVVNREKILCPCGVDVDCSSEAQAAMTTAQPAYFFPQTRRGPAQARISADFSIQAS